MPFPIAAAIIPAAAAIGGSIINAVNQNSANDSNIAMQKEFAQMGVRWKVADATAAGLHPLAALGAQTTSFSPSSVGDTGIGNALSESGQHFGRAIAATQSEEEKKMDAYRLASAHQDVEGKALQNQILSHQLKTLQFGQPSFPGSTNFLPGQGNSNLIVTEPVKRNASEPGRPAQEAGWRPDVSYSRTDTGMTPMIPTGLSESLEDDIIGKFMWRLRNQLAPNFTGQGKPPQSQAPDGHKWRWNVNKQEWQPYNAREIGEAIKKMNFNKRR